MTKLYLSFFLLLLTGVCHTRAQSVIVNTAPHRAVATPAVPDSEDPSAEPPEKRTRIVPIPVNMEMLEGAFTLDSITPILIDPNKTELKELAAFFSKMIELPTGFRFPISASSKPGNGKGIYLNLNQTADHLIGKEGYRLEVTKERITLRANQPQGLFYGMQTVLQLLPPDIAATRRVNDVKWEVPCVRVTDFPRFGWRGLMLDVSRHFFPVSFVKKYIDQLAKYKMNRFHWHLTDDQGWRIEIKSLPRLTSVGAWRVTRTGTWWDRERPAPGEVPDYGGYYTQEEIREVVRYAEKRFVTILPEIDVPGHSLAAIAAYPELACVEDIYYVNPGSRYYGEVDNSLCVGNEQVYDFLDKVFTEVAELFPGKYIHVGGDEAYKGFWRKCPKCQRKMQAEGLRNVNELQSYFIKRAEKILQSKGKQLIGWDEILEGGLAPNATVMSWRGMDGGIQAAKMGHRVIMTPKQHCYIDLYQGDPMIEPPTYSMLRLTDSYHFNPVPPGVNPEMILGGQGNLWTESVPNERHAEYMTWPRALALAEVFWSPQERKNWTDFIGRMEAQFKRFDAAEINYSRSAYDPIVTPRWAPGKKDILIALDTEIPGLEIYYSFDGTWPDNFLDQYLGEPLRVPKGADTFRVTTYKNGTKVGKTISFRISELWGKLPAPM